MPIADYYTTAEAAELLGLSQPAVQNAVRRGALRAEKVIRRLGELARERANAQP